MNSETLESENTLARQLLQHMPEPAPGANTRVAMRLDRSRALVRPNRASRYAAAGSVLLMAAAAAVYFFPAPAAPAFSAPALASETKWQTAQSDGVALSFRGTGTVDGKAKSPHIDWQRGTLNVEVTPNYGVDLRVQTREAEVHVIGTGFSVRRDALGTHVDVRHGVVETRCGDEAAVRLFAGDSVTCLPRSAAGLLGRARALSESGAETSAVLSSIEAGVALAPVGGPVAVELGVTKAETLALAGRPEEALRSVHALLKAGAGVRHDELVVLGAALATSIGGCDVAAPWLKESAALAGVSCDAAAIASLP